MSKKVGNTETKIGYKEIYFIVRQSGEIARQVNTRHPGVKPERVEAEVIR